MEMKEVFPRPLVKQVIFTINFPNLFYIEDKIPNLQEKIMDKFPESNLLFRRNILIADLGPNVNISDLDDDKLKTEKIWQFGSPNKYELNITTKQLDISSKFHKTYDNPESEIIRGEN